MGRCVESGQGMVEGRTLSDGGLPGVALYATTCRTSLPRTCPSSLI